MHEMWEETPVMFFFLGGKKNASFYKKIKCLLEKKVFIFSSEASRSALQFDC